MSLTINKNNGHIFGAGEEWEWECKGDRIEVTKKGMYLGTIHSHGTKEGNIPEEAMRMAEFDCCFSVALNEGDDYNTSHENERNH